MVENTGKTLCADTYKPVNTPEAARVEEDASGLPAAVRTPRRRAIVSIEDRWRLDDEWWRSEPLSRLYYTVLLASGEKMVLFKDLIGENGTGRENRGSTKYVPPLSFPRRREYRRGNGVVGFTHPA